MEESNLNNAAVEETQVTEPNAEPPKSNKFVQSLDKFFGITAKGSTIRTEIIGGLTTFFAMCYILIVNPNQMTGFLVDGTNAVWQAVFIATAIGAIVGTLLMAFLAKMPFAQAPGMGLNSFFFVSFLVTGFGSAASVFAPGGDMVASYEAGLSIILLSGVIFMIISVTGLRKKIATAMPDCLKKAIPAGIGLFIAYIGFQNVDLIQANQYTQVQLVDLSVVKGGGAAAWYSIVPAIVAFLGVLIIAFLQKTRIKKASVILGIVISAALYYLFNIGNEAAFVVFKSMVNPGTAFVSWGQVGIGAAFKGFKYWTAGSVLTGIMLVITFCLVDMFDTFGTLQGTAAEAKMLDKDGNPENLGKCLAADSTATLVGAVAGTSTVTTYVESAAGVSAGARTGLSSLVVAGLFFIAMFLSPIISIIPSAAVAPALIYVGVLMLGNFKQVDFSDMTSAVPAFLTLIIMPLSYSISNGIAVGMISYSILKIASVLISGKQGIADYFKAGKGNWGDFWSKDIFVLVIAILFALRFFLVKM